MEHIISEYSSPEHFLLHFSDTHLLSGNRMLYGAIDADSRLERIIDEIVGSGIKPEAIVFTGDVADEGEPGAYNKARTMVSRLAGATGAKPIWVMGNHDNRESFRTNLLQSIPSNEPVDEVHDINGLRIIVLDTSVPGQHHGNVSRRQLDWLEDVLSTPSLDGTILALHHPPIPAVNQMAMTVELRDQKPLAEVLRGSDVRSIIGGHVHYSCFATFAGIPVSVASSTCYTQDLAFAATGGGRGHDLAQGFNMVHVHDETVLHSVVPVGIGSLVGMAADAQEVKDRLSTAGITRREKSLDGEGVLL